MCYVRFEANKEESSFKIIVKSGVLDVSYHLCEPFMISWVEWKAFTDCLSTGGRDCLSFCNSNGLVEIETRNGNIIFCVSKAGRGGDGYLEVSMPNQYAVDSFTRMTEIVKFEASSGDEK